MGTYQINDINESLTQGKTTATLPPCPKCGNKIIPLGTFLQQAFTVPVKVKILFISINMGVNIDLQFCPRCGRLKCRVEQA